MDLALDEELIDLRFTFVPDAFGEFSLLSCFFVTINIYP